MKRVLVTTAAFGEKLNSRQSLIRSNWPDQKSDKYKITFNRINSENEYSRNLSMSPRLRAKIPKMLVWEEHEEYDYYIWLDSGFSIKDEYSIEKFIIGASDYDCCFFRHSTRSSVDSELNFVLKLMSEGDNYLISRYSGEKMLEQIKTYKRDSTWQDDVLFECGSFLYTKRLIANRDYNLLKEWFYHNCLWSIQDQLSLPYLLHKFNVKYGTYTGSVFSNDYFNFEHN